MARNTEARKARIAQRQQIQSVQNMGSIGCAVLILFGALFGLHQCTQPDQPSEDELEAEAAATTANREKGFHCLSLYDGSNASIVTQVESGLRNPDSFEHIDTLITPVSPESGKHGVTMTFRAENGFGGINVGRAVGEVDPESCNAVNVIVDG